LETCSSTSIATVNLCRDLKHSAERLLARGTVKTLSEQDSPLSEFTRYKNIKHRYGRRVWDLNAEKHASAWEELGQLVKWKPDNESPKYGKFLWVGDSF